jgi:alpha-L-rhamnosidase
MMNFKFLTLAFCLIIGINVYSRNNQQPNIVFILTDDQRFDALSFAGNPYVKTPNIDALAKQGKYFKNAITTTPICAGSRASIISGLYERSHSYNFQTGDIRIEYMANSYPKILKDNGYQTAFFGKFGVNFDGFKSLFDQAENYDRNNKYSDKRSFFYKRIGKDTVHLTRYTGQQAIDYINLAPSQKPFCLSLSFSAPHAHDSSPDQYYWQKESNDWLKDVKIPDPQNATNADFEKLPEAVKAGFSRLRWTWRFDNPGKYQRMVKGYFRMINEIDTEVGKIRETLKKKKLDKNTIIIFCGDNGYFLGERQIADKWLMYDLSVKIPMIIYDPRFTKAMVIKEQVTNVDIPATILSLAGVKVPRSYQGKDISKLNDQSNGSEYLLIEHLWNFKDIPPSEGVRSNKWKYFRYVNDQALEELYDLEKDPQETNNLSKNSAFASQLSFLRNKMEELIKSKSNDKNLPPFGLTVEMIREPKSVLIVDTKPEVGWKLPSNFESQNAYQILISNDSLLLKNNIGNIWNSNVVANSTSTNIEYKGSDLKIGSTYYWKVRCYDSGNRLSPYSEMQSFTVGKDEKYLTTPNAFHIEYIKPQIKMVGSIYQLDFAKDAFGNLLVEGNLDGVDSVVFHLGEQLTNGLVERNPTGTIRYQRVTLIPQKGKNKHLLNLKRDIRNTNHLAIALPDSFGVITPFRYAEIDSPSDQIKNLIFTQKAYFNYWDNNQSSFECDNDTLNQIWDLCKYSMKVTTFAGYYVDGDRERIPYEADAYINQLTHYANDAEYAIGRRTIEYFMEYPTWPSEWQLHVALMMWADYEYTGNTELIEKYYESLKYKSLYPLNREDGLITTTKVDSFFMKKLGFKDMTVKLKDITDWPPAQKDTQWKVVRKEGERDGFEFMSYNTIINALHYRNLQIMGEFAKILKNTKEQLLWEEKAGKVKKAFNENLINKETGYYVDGEGSQHSSLHANMFALAFDLVPDNNKKAVVDFIKTRDMACSVYGAQYLLEGLYKAGEADYGLKMMTKGDDRGWFNMIRIGSTITLEAWDMKHKPNADWNHAWGAAPGNVISRWMWGIRPKAPGAKILTMDPQMSTLKHSKIKAPFIMGNIEAEYVQVNKTNKYFIVKVPANMGVEFKLGDLSKEIILDGNKLTNIFDTVFLAPGEHKIEFKSNSF